MKPKFHCGPHLGLIILSFAAAGLSNQFAQADNTWDGGGSSPFNWSDNTNWGSNTAPSYGTLVFTGALGTTNTIDANYSMNQINWNGSSAWTLDNSGGAVLSLFDNSGTQAKVESLGTGGVTINAPITFAATTGSNWGEINAVSSSITFGTGTLTVNGSGVNGIRMFGGAGGISTTFNNTVSASGKYFSTSAVGQTINIGGAFTSGDFYLMNTGTLNLNSGGNLSTSQLRLGGDFGTTGTQDLTKGATFALTNLTGGQSFSSGINTVGSNTSGALIVDSQNTSGTNTISSVIALDSALKIQQAAGGALSMTGGGFDIKSQTLTMAVGTGGTITVNEALGSGNAAGGNLIKTGAGTLILQSTSNNYTGTSSGSLTSTEIQGGTLGIYGDTSLGLAPGGVFANSLKFTGNGTLQDTSNNISLVANRGITISSGITATFDSNGNTFGIGGIIAGSGGSVAKIGAGTLVLSGANTFTGGTTISVGVVSVGADNNLGTGVVSLNGGTLKTTAGITNTHAMTIGASGGTINVTTTGQYFFNTANTLLGTGALTLTGNGTLTANTSNLRIGQTNTFSGELAINSGGILEWGVANALASTAITVGNQGEFALNNNVTLGSGVGITVTGGTNSVLSFINGTGGVYAGGITLNANAIIGLRDWYNNATVRGGTISGTISGSGALSVNSGSGSGGTLTLTGSNSYIGGTTVAGAILQLGNGGTTGTLSTTGAITLNTNGFLQINRSNAVAQGADFNGSGLTGAGGLTQAGSGTTTLNVANTFAGATTLTAGTLSVADTTYLGGITANNSIVFNGGTFQITGTTMTSFGSHTPTYNASKTIGFDINHASNNFDAGATAFATGSTDTLLKTGAGTLTLGAASNTIKALQLNQGTLNLGANNLTISNAGTTTINSSTTNSVVINATGGGKIVLTQNNATDGPDIGVANGGTLTINANITGTSAFESWTGTNNGTGVTILTGANDYTGNTIINGGVLSVSNVGNTGSTTSNLGQGGTIHMGTGTVSTGTLKYTGTGEISNRVINLNGSTAGGIIDASGGSGTLEFSSNLTAVAGSKTLTLQGSGLGKFSGILGNGSGTVAVNKAGTGTWTLSGANTYTGQTTVSAGTLSYTGSLASGSQINVGVAGGGNAVMNLQSGSSITLNASGTNHIVVGVGTTSTTGQGFLYQSGGAITGSTGGTSPYSGLQIGNGASGSSYGYYNLSGGTASVNEVDIGGFNGAATGVLDMSAGTLTASTWLIASRSAGSGGIGILNLTGGALNYTGVAGQFQNNWGSNGTAVINVAGTFTAANADINLNQSNNATNFGAINLLTGGTLQAHSIASSANGTKLVNFNGGTLKASTATTTFITTSNSAVNVYGGGGTIDNNGVAITIPVALLAPSGNGVTATGVTITGGSGYLGAPAVTFTGGGGSGAAGYVTVSGGIITGLVITNPGTGYTSAPTVTLTGGGSTSGAITLAAPVANTSGGMTYAGSGTTTLTGASTSYTGATTISAGTLSVSTLANGGANSNIGASSNAAANLILNGGTLQYTGAAVSTDRLFSLQSDSTLNASGSGAVNFTNTGAMGFNGGTAAKTLTLTGTNTGLNTLATVIGNNTGQTSVTKTSAGTWVISGSNTYTGTTAINGGILNAATLANGGSASAIGAGANTVGLLTFNGGTLQYTGSTAQSTNHLFTINTSGATLDASGTGSGTMSFTNTGSLSGGSGATARNLTLAGSNTGTNHLASGIVDGSGAAVGLTKSGAGTWALSGTNSYTGATAINVGTLQFNSASAMSTTSGLTVNSGGTLSLKADADTTFLPASIGTQSGAITVNITAGALSAGSNKTLTLGSSSIGLQLTGDNTVSVSASNGYTVAIPLLLLNQTANDGTMQTLSVASGATLQVGTVTANDVNNRLRFTGAGNTVIAGPITQAQANRGMGLVFDQSGTVTLSGTGTNLRNNTNSGSDKNIVLNSGTVNFNSTAAISSSQSVAFIINGGTVDNTSGGAITLAGTHPISIVGDFAYGGTNDLNLGNQSTTLNGAAGSRTITTNGSATLTLSGAIANGTSTGLTKAGTGTLALTNTNTYAGATAVELGKLVVSGFIGNSAVTVTGLNTTLASGTTGTIGGSVTINNGAILAAGDVNAIGTATVVGATTFNTDSIFSWDLAATPDTTGRGSNYDALNSGSLSATTGAIFRVVLNADQDFSDSFWDTTRQWTDIFKNGGTSLDFETIFSGGVQYYNGSGVLTGVTSTQGAFTISGSNLTWSAVPEPTSAFAGFLIGAGLLRRRRRN